MLLISVIRHDVFYWEYLLLLSRSYYMFIASKQLWLIEQCAIYEEDKTRQDNDLIDRTSPLYAKHKTELLWPNRWGTIYEKDQTKQQCYWS